MLWPLEFSNNINTYSIARYVYSHCSMHGEEKKISCCLEVFYDQYFIAFHKTSNFLRVFKDNARIQCNVLFSGEIAIFSPIFFQTGKVRDRKKYNLFSKFRTEFWINHIFFPRLKFLEEESNSGKCSQDLCRQTWKKSILLHDNMRR